MLIFNTCKILLSFIPTNFTLRHFQNSRGILVAAILDPENEDLSLFKTVLAFSRSQSLVQKNVLQNSALRLRPFSFGADSYSAFGRPPTTAPKPLCDVRQRSLSSKVTSQLLLPLFVIIVLRAATFDNCCKNWCLSGHSPSDQGGSGRESNTHSTRGAWTQNSRKDFYRKKRARTTDQRTSKSIQ